MKESNEVLFEEESNFHNKMAIWIGDRVHQYYYKPLSKKTKKKVNELLFHYDEFIFKPDYISYVLFYQIYCISHFWSSKQILYLNFHLHSFYILYLLESFLIQQYSYQSHFDNHFLKKSAFYLYYYILYFKIHFHPIHSSIKNTCLGILSTYCLLMNYHDIYKNRLESLQHKKESEHSLRKIFILTPNPKTMKKILYHTRHFTFSNFLFLISILLLFIL